jgi:hypothetical protein
MQVAVLASQADQTPSADGAAMQTPGGALP